MKKFSDTDIAKAFQHREKNKVLAYIELMYGQKSELNKIQDLKERKKTAMSIAKLNPEDEAMQDVMEMKNDTVNDLIFYYRGMFQNSNQYDLLSSKQQLFWDVRKIISTPVNEDDFKDGDMLEKKNEITDGSFKRIKRIIG